ncbi:MAG: transporter [Bacteroidota bacterium]
MKNILFFVLTIFVFVESKSQNLWTSGRPDGHAPIGVMGDHTHNKGEWMASYRFMQMRMSGLINGTEGITQAEAHNDYMMLPDNMIMRMHMVGAMYAISNRLTVMSMIPFTQKEMEMHMRTAPDGTNFGTTSQSIGDLSVSSAFKFLDANGQRAHLNFGLSIPTGSIDEKAVTPMSDPMEAQLPYPMQIGSGSYELMPGMTYLSELQKFSFGSQIKSRLRLNKNDHDFKFGNVLNFTGWTAYKINEWVSSSVRLSYNKQGAIKGQDPIYMNPMMSPALETQNSGGQRVDTGLGINTYFSQGLLKGWRLGLEYLIPVYQNTNGLQMKNNHTAIFGIQYSF